MDRNPADFGYWVGLLWTGAELAMFHSQEERDDREDNHRGQNHHKDRRGGHHGRERNRRDSDNYDEGSHRAHKVEFHMCCCDRIDKTVNKVDLLETGTDTGRAEAHPFTVVDEVDYLMCLTPTHADSESRAPSPQGPSIPAPSLPALIAAKSATTVQP